MQRRTIDEIPGIGEKTEKDLRRAIKGSRPTGNIGNKVSVTEAMQRKYRGVVKSKLNARQRKNLEEASAGGGLLDPEERRRMSDDDRDREKSDRKVVGDFVVSREAQRDAHEFHQDRPAEAREQDEDERAPIVTDFSTWASDPDHLDFPGIDTPRRKPRVDEKDEGTISEDDVVRDPLDFF